MLVIARAGPYRASREHARVTGTGACWAGEFGVPGTRARGAALSSAILYLAIVAIWAVVLVPRWLRPSRNSGTLESNLAEPMDVGSREDLAHEGLAGEDDSGGDSLPRPSGAAGVMAPDRRARILQARRRTLVTLLVLTGGAVMIAMAHLAADWVVIPPVVMLAGFMLLLREAARADAERARAAASRHRRQQARPARRDQAGPVGAEIIDISARVGDQLYDQYADAEVRAVGD
jgi:hypothetical protein